MKKENNSKEKLIVALDVDTLAEVRTILERLSDSVDIFKIGSQLFTSCGPAVVRFVEAKGKKVFLDLKFHDIPNTVASAVSAAVSLSVALDRSTDFNNRKKATQRGILMMTVHTSGGFEMMKAAAEAAAKTAQEVGVNRPLLVGVTVLTSDKKTDNILSLVLERAALAKLAGLDGVVASCQEAAAIRQKFGKDFVIVTPGIRPAGADAQDQQRIATPAEAVKSGSNFLVVGRPILQAKNPAKAARDICDEISKAI